MDTVDDSRDTPGGTPPQTSSALPAVRFLKGHGTGNDFVVVPDPDGLLDLSAAQVALVCDRREGIGGDGLLRVVRSAPHPQGRAMAAEAEWFTDYRNADGSVAEMCGNGSRVFARHLVAAGLAPAGELPVATRAGVRRAHLPERGPGGAPGDVAVDMGPARFPGTRVVEVAVGARRWPARNVNMGNPHAVAFVGDLADAGDLLTAPVVTPADVYPERVNVEFVVDRGPRHPARRVRERGIGRDPLVRHRGLCRDGRRRPQGRRGPGRHRGTGHVPGRCAGGRLVITERSGGRIGMSGPAVIVAEGLIDRNWLAGVYGE